MHLAEGTLPLGAAAIGWCLALPALAWSLRGARAGSIAGGPEAGEAQGSSLLPAATSLLFATTLLPLPVPVLGATSHLCLTPVLALLLGVRAIVWPTFFVLLVQALFFAHGGLTTLGVNTLSLGLVGPMVALGAAGGLRRLGASAALTLGLATALGDLAVYGADAVWLALGLAEAAPPAQTLGLVLLGFAPVQVPLAALEGVASVALARALARRRPDLLPGWLATGLRAPGRPAAGATLMLALAAMLPGCDYEGLDGTVYGAAAASAGRPPTASLIDLSGGELGLAAQVGLPLVFGFIAGRAWERIAREGHAPPG